MNSNPEPSTMKKDAKGLLWAIALLGTSCAIITCILGLIACYDINDNVLFYLLFFQIDPFDYLKEGDLDSYNRFINPYPVGYIGNDKCFSKECIDCVVYEADSGWFYRRHQYCTSELSKGCATGFDAYNLVMTCGILCPILYIVAVVFNLLTICTKKLIWTMISTGSSLLGFLIFIGVFGAVMVQINIYNTEVLDGECDVVKEHLRGSDNTFMGYWVASFTYIPFLILFNIGSMCNQKVHGYTGGGKQEYKREEQIKG